VASQARVQPWLTPFMHCPNPPPIRKHPSLVPTEEVRRGLASEGAVPAHSLLALPSPAPHSPRHATSSAQVPAMPIVQPCSVLSHAFTRKVFRQKWEGRATGTESAEPRGYRAASPATPPGVGGVGTRFLRTGCTVLWQLSQNLVGSEFTIPRPFPFAFHGGTVAARVAGMKYCQVAEKGELSVKTRYSCSTSTPVLDLIDAPRHGCPNAACRNRTKTSLRATKSSHAHFEHLHTFAYGHSHYGPVHHRRRFQRRF